MFIVIVIASLFYCYLFFLRICVTVLNSNLPRDLFYRDWSFIYREYVLKMNLREKKKLDPIYFRVGGIIWLDFGSKTDFQNTHYLENDANQTTRKRLLHRWTWRKDRQGRIHAESDRGRLEVTTLRARREICIRYGGLPNAESPGLPCLWPGSPHAPSSALWLSGDWRRELVGWAMEQHLVAWATR